VTATAKTTVAFGIAFLLLAAGFYVGTGMKSWTALLPGVWGVIYLVCGLAARTPRSTKIAMHVAAVFALLGLLTIGRPLMSWTTPPDPALIEQLRLAVLNGVLLLIYIRSFIAARRAA